MGARKRLKAEARKEGNKSIAFAKLNKFLLRLEKWDWLQILSEELRLTRL